ncbi:L-aspartate oxidase [Melioribacteraceae bacterium 4301-Me]|uniref:L-aspartate oxidase n=1 Tax=Pyranulibacter aquaticus TaxID=3163344 RepID=UPI003599D5DF
MSRVLKYDYVIIGCGLAGLHTALKASKYGKVLIVSKSTLQISNSYWAQGGIAAAISPNDSTEEHYADTIKAGRGLCKPEAVKILVEEGRQQIIELINMGMPFDKNKNGEISFGLEGGHCKRRILHAGGDATGKELVKFVTKLISEKKNIDILENTIVHKLLVNDGECNGVSAYNLSQKENLLLTGKSFILATGGASAIYSRTTNPHVSTGEGISLAYEAGAEIESMEFIQFHPTSFYTESGETFLISEAVRGEGAIIVNHKDVRFLNEQKINELAPRDVLSTAIFNEMKKTKKQFVFLKLNHLDPQKIKSRFSNIYNEAIKYGIDITKDPVPVAPAAHYMIGGIKTGIYAQTNIKRLYSVGESASSGVHGANRLASNSLLECLVFSNRAVENMKDLEINNQQFFERTAPFVVNENNKPIYIQCKNYISEILSNNVGIVRNHDCLSTAKKQLEEKFIDFQNQEDELYLSRCKSLLTVASLITNAALFRKETRGCHIRSDFKDEDKTLICTTIQKKGESIKFQKIN